MPEIRFQTIIGTSQIQRFDIKLLNSPQLTIYIFFRKLKPVRLRFSCYSLQPLFRLRHTLCHRIKTQQYIAQLFILPASIAVYQMNKFLHTGFITVIGLQYFIQRFV